MGWGPRRCQLSQQRGAEAERPKGQLKSATQGRGARSRLPCAPHVSKRSPQRGYAVASQDSKLFSAS